MADENLRERLRRTSQAVKAAKTSLDDAREERNLVICEAEEAGWTIGEIAIPTAMSRAAIHQIVWGAETEKIWGSPTGD